MSRRLYYGLSGNRMGTGVRTIRAHPRFLHCVLIGYMTTTHIKFLLILSDDASTALNEQRAIDEAIKHLFFKLHRLFVEYTLNPFSPLTGEPLQSPRFDQKVQDCILSFNRTI